MVVIVLLSLLGLLVLGSALVIHLQMGALADALHDAREEDAQALSIQLDAITDKLTGIQLAMESQGKAIDAPTVELEGPLSVRRPAIQEPRDLLPQEDLETA